MQYHFRYRGFDVSVIPADVPYYNGQGFENCDGVYCEVFADTDPERIDLLGSCSLAVGHDIQSTSEKDVFDGVRDFTGTLNGMENDQISLLLDEESEMCFAKNEAAYIRLCDDYVYGGQE